jgi:HD-GYP domain-containing protein (c-di-GMP phosphodiesterase class II)
LCLAGLCHDLGKLLIPEDVLAKPAALSVDERRLLDRHPDAGAAMSRRLGLDEEAAEYIRYHHKAFRTGSGNPPLGARVLAVADAFVTMTSERPYRSARSLSSAVSELRRCRGEQFDPDVVDAVPHALLDGVPVPAP